MLIIILVLFILIGLLAINYSLNSDVLIKKGYENSDKSKYLALIPFYGNMYVSKLPNLKNQVSEEEINYLKSPQMILKKAAIIYTILLLSLIVLAPLSVLVYLSFTNNAMATFITIFGIVLILLVHQGLVVEYAKKKGYEGVYVGLIGLIPIYGFVHFRNLPKRRNTSPLTIRATFSPKSILSKLLINAELSLLALVVIIPVIYIFGMAFSESQSSIPNQLFPSNPSWNGFNYLLFSEESRFAKWYTNTLFIALINMVVGTIIITGAAYVFARFNFKGKKSGLLAILVLQAFPSFMGLVAMYVLFWKFGMLGQPLYLSILYIGGAIPGNLWLIKGFLSQIPKDLDESAMIDGASKIKIFTKIILPLAVPILTFVAVSMFMGPWMDYMLPGYLLNTPAPGASLDQVQDQWTLAVGIFSYINDPASLNYPAFASAALIVGLPIAVIYMVFQRYLIEGIMAGATKG